MNNKKHSVTKYNKENFKYMIGVKMRLFPSHKQEKIIKKNFNIARFVYNQLIANSWTDSKIPQINKQYPQVKRLIGLQRIKHCGLYPWLKDKNIDSLALCNAEINYKSAWNMYNKIYEAGTPNFKRKYDSNQSYSTNCRYNKKISVMNESIFNGSIKFLDSNHIKLPKLGNVHVMNSFNLPTKQRIRISKVTISTDGINYYVSLLLKSNKPLREQFAKTNSELGIDLNLDNFYMSSNGDVVANPRYYKHAKKRLAFNQRILSRRQRVAKKRHKKLYKCKRYQKQKAKVRELQHHIKNQRSNFLHNLSITLIKNQDLVVAEELRSKNMMKNHALASSIQDVGWRTFINQLEYKAKLYGKQFITVSPAYTTQTCNDCGYIMKGKEHLTLKDREWTCPNCNIYHIRDVNAAKNILNKGKIKLTKLKEEQKVA